MARRPRIKCALCGKRRVPPVGVKTVRHLTGRKIGLCVEWTVGTYMCICNQCNNTIEKLMFAGLWEKI